eukprot:TRINITY_DN10241_c0_g1_i1.p1 TRINITY_DN10241_c0_g1~~TRINITY_DN10241_c0_g1_i1.p1  ORF type:complete len:686 (-),score=128.86 TRINITY_DN10241_c0_g1_i1:17-2074(-)
MLRRPKNGISRVVDNVHSVFNLTNQVFGYEDMYRDTYSAVTSKQGDRLVRELDKLFRSHIQLIRREIDGFNEEDFFDKFAGKLDEFYYCLIRACDILMYLERTFMDVNNMKTFHQRGNEMLGDLILTEEMTDRFNEQLNFSIASFRNGEFGQVETFNNSAKLFATLKVLSTATEERLVKSFLDKSQKFLCSTSTRLIDELSVEQCIADIFERYKREIQIQDTFGIPSVPLFKEIMVVEYMYTFNREINKMLKFDDFEGLNKLYQLYEGIEGAHEILVSEVTSYLKDEVSQMKEIISSNSMHDEYIEKVVHLDDKFNHVVKDSFMNNKFLKVDIENTFESLLSNADSGYYLAQYFDKKIPHSDGEIKGDIERGIALIEYFFDRDIFKKYYQYFLGKRLLTDSSVSHDNEKQMIQTLTVKYGTTFQSLTDMIDDIATSKEVMNGFEQPEFTFHVNVLSSAWPSGDIAAETCLFPDTLSSVCESFSKYYMDVFNRIIIWTSLGGGDLVTKFSKSSHILSVSTPMLSLLLLYNEFETLKVFQMIEGTGLKERQLKKMLGLLVKKNKNMTPLLVRKGEYGMNCEFSLNEKFASRIKKINLSRKHYIPLKTEKFDQSILTERHALIELGIMKIMKDKKKFTKQQLITETQKLLIAKFPAKDAQIEKRIQTLIEREYLEEDENNPNELHYLS